MTTFSKFTTALRLAAVIAVGAGLTGLAHAADVPAPLKAKAAPVDLPFFLVNDNRLTLAYMPEGTYAGYFSRRPDGSLNGSTERIVAAFTHFDVWAYGTNFANLQVTKSKSGIPAAPCTNVGVIQTSFVTSIPSDCAGSTSFYGQIRSTFGFNEITGTKNFAWGPLRNISLQVGGDAGVDNTLNSSAKKALMGGLQFAFDLPYKGYLNVAPMVYKEWNHVGFSQCGMALANNTNPGTTCLLDGNTEFNTTWTVEANYYMDLGFLPESIQFFAISGRAAWIGKKGNDTSPLAPAANGGAGVPTKVSLDSEPIRLTFDASKAAWGQKYSHFLDVWVAYRYSENKAGFDNDRSFLCIRAGVSTNSCTESTYYTGVTVKF